MKKWGVILLVLITCGIGFVWRSYGEKEEVLQITEANSHEAPLSVAANVYEIQRSLYVQICGAVTHPGVYEVAENTRCFQVIEMAGGLTEDAALESINQAAIVSDGQMINVKTLSQMSENTMEEANGLININLSSVEQLVQLPGVGESRAEDIIRYREENGPFQKLEDIMKVQGIKEGMFNKIKDKITI